MKIFIVLLIISTGALASLEPASYRPPGVSSTTQYLSPHYDDSHQQSKAPASVASSQYLAPTLPSTGSPDGAAPYFYEPPQTRLKTPVPATKYLPASEKPHSAIPSPPANDYLPPLPPLPSSSALPSTEYLPPLSRAPPTSAPTTEYLTPSRTTPSVPPTNYLPPIPSSRAPPRQDYLPPVTREPIPLTTKSQYLPPSSGRKTVDPTTPAAKTGPISSSANKFSGPAYGDTKRGGRPSTSFPLPTSSTSLPTKGGGQFGRSFASRPELKGIESNPVDNYLSPVASTPTEPQSLDQSGYRYGATAAAAAGAHETTETAKYDFEYRVSDEFGNDFGHKESRAGSQIHGSYSVLLPDGRKQIVHYEADESGFKPRISYEEAATVLGPKTPDIASEPGFAGYDGNSNSLTGHSSY